jgi:hypothetical protein
VGSKVGSKVGFEVGSKAGPEAGSKVFRSGFQSAFYFTRDRGSCPGIFAAALVPGQWESGTRKLFLSRDKGTAGQGNFFVPGQRDNRTSRPLETLVLTSSI